MGKGKERNGAVYVTTRKGGNFSKRDQGQWKRVNHPTQTRTANPKKLNTKSRQGRCKKRGDLTTKNWKKKREKFLTCTEKECHLGGGDTLLMPQGSLSTTQQQPNLGKERYRQDPEGIHETSCHEREILDKRQAGVEGEDED